MTDYLLLNAGLASALAVIAFLASRVVKNAAVLHLLWVGVLLRFVVPPLIDIPIMGVPVEPTSAARGETQPSSLPKPWTR